MSRIHMEGVILQGGLWIAQGMTGKKRQYTSIPYKSIDYFSKETAGHFDLDAEINIWIKSRKEPIVLEFRKDTHIHDVFKVLSHYALAS